MGSTDLCCICLDEPALENPLLLLSCGCKVALFHESCEKNWLDSLPIDKEIVCFICKRPPSLKDNYSICYNIGPAQKQFWDTSLLFTLEIPIAIHYGTPIILLEGLYIILFPFVCSFTQDIRFFLSQYKYTVYINLIFILIYKDSLGFYDIVLYRLIHLLFLCLIISKQRVNPLTPFIISREIIHSKTVWPQ
jgi:hypothetical protein